MPHEPTADRACQRPQHDLIPNALAIAAYVPTQARAVHWASLTGKAALQQAGTYSCTGVISLVLLASCSFVNLLHFYSPDEHQW